MEELQDGLYQYTHRVLQVLLQESVFPDAIQFGNEISAGMLWPIGKLPLHKDWDPTDHDITQEWENVVKLIQTGIQAMDDVLQDVQISLRPTRPRVVIHLDTGGDSEFTQHWMETYLALQGTCDIIGLSWYPMWHGTLEDLRKNIDNLSNKFPDQEVWLVETAYYWEGYCAADDPECRAKFPFPLTEQGQSDHLGKLRDMLLQTKCRAVFYWGSHWTQPQKWFRSEAGETWEDAERRALFNRTGHVLTGMATLAGHSIE
uniref:arabinogalactan endo-beta-1,4-galactanase n=1 Tax=Amphora coffeiformis TaxID=265554 RepID=A0A7S3P3T7_9STRA|mmetsp:Transcript_1838/g.3541  ORF Transcript_1838/g.3541 Transcript_1838/m.3541 type:complete len:259 (+) Transcript_1838:741-1517(+)|eukprot:scaffold936_cov106-Amphora_coffeaeformis.AAC.23